MSKFEHLKLPVTTINLPKRSKGGGSSGGTNRDRSSHGQKLSDQVLGLLKRPEKERSLFTINPKLIFKIKLAPKSILPEASLPGIGLTLLAQESSEQKAIVVFSSEQELTNFQEKLKVYSNVGEGYDYGYLDVIEDIVPLEPQDRVGRRLELEPLEANELVALDLELWHTGDLVEMKTYLDNLDEVLRTITEDSPMRVSDRYIGEYICIARIKVTKEFVEDILLTDEYVKEIDRRPQPAFESSSEYNPPLSDFPEIAPPPDNICGILVIDSGVHGGHPAIIPALAEASEFSAPNFVLSSPNDENGHGTGVSGIAIYGDIKQCITNRLFQPTAWLFSARVTDANNQYDPDSLLENQLEKAINYFIKAYPNCKVINISLGDSRLVFTDGQKQFRLAAKIDEIAYSYQDKNLVFVISAGNFQYNPDSNELIHSDYPNYLLNEKAGIIEPATSAIALSVGSLSLGMGSFFYHEDAQRNVVAKILGYPSPFTRSGFGVDGAIKPELVDFGGDLVIDRTRVIYNDPSAAILTLSKDSSSSLFRAYCGTSFAAPRIANIAAQLFTEFPNASSNLIRALIVNSATLPKEIPSAFQGDTHKNNRNKIYGYGRPNLARALYSVENYVVLLVDNAKIPVGNFQMYEIPPLPKSFLETKGDRTLTVTLAFDPPTRPTRGDSYLGITMEFHLFRNIDDPQKITNAFVNAKKTESENDFTEISIEDLKKQYPGSGITVDLSPGVNLRKKGTVQSGKVKIKDRALYIIENPLYLVVACNRKWVKEGEYDSQRYAIVVSVEHSDHNVDLYNELRLKTQVVQRVRIRS
ncbi:S8 family peptidase [Pseudanabaena sp. FACHB-1277]|uniref:S8 family peptidase n=1 Tax=Pseudanabaena cinerea FACHB-1277 TaxID=2949581 RepID=A0A926UUR0_9CYAN|nr:S8 family peptidase [Pseudanabaena cinerea]MBD2151078.1 S8 family peptidase [Pseudanabaena cinerea FACHB-1277]